jgi:hypothetical protein
MKNTQTKRITTQIMSQAAAGHASAEATNTPARKENESQSSGMGASFWCNSTKHSKNDTKGKDRAAE